LVGHSRRGRGKNATGWWTGGGCREIQQVGVQFMIFFEAFMIWYLLTTSFVHVHSRGSNIFGSKIIKFLALVWIEPDQLHFFGLRSTSSVPKYEMFCQAKVIYQTVLYYILEKKVLYKNMINRKII
jgi:hypothetical protein